MLLEKKTMKDFTTFSVVVELAMLRSGWTGLEISRLSNEVGTVRTCTEDDIGQKMMSFRIKYLIVLYTMSIVVA